MNQMNSLKKSCKNCLFCYCVGIYTETNQEFYECHESNPKLIGANINDRLCEKWEPKDNVIRLYGVDSH